MLPVKFDVVLYDWYLIFDKIVNRLLSLCSVITGPGFDLTEEVGLSIIGLFALLLLWFRENYVRKGMRFGRRQRRFSYFAYGDGLPPGRTIQIGEIRFRIWVDR